MKALQLTSVD